MVICLERGADLHMAQWMPLPLTVSCFSKIQIGFTFLVPAHMGSHGERAVKRECVCKLQFIHNLFQARAKSFASILFPYFGLFQVHFQTSLIPSFTAANVHSMQM